MCRIVLPILVAPFLLAAAPTELPSGAVWTVGPGGDFADIQPAVDAAAPGDIVLVSPGNYGAVEVASTTLAIVGLQARPGDVACGQLRVRDLDEDEIVLVSGLSASGDPDGTQEDEAGARFSDNFGILVVQDCQFAGAGYEGEGSVVDACEAAYFSKSACSGGEAGIGLRVLNANVAFHRSTANGGDGPIGGTGCSAIFSFLSLAGSHVQGGDGFDTFPADAGSGLLLHDSEVFTLDSLSEAGVPGSWCELVCKNGLPGDDVIVTGSNGQYTELAGSHRALDLPAAIEVSANGTAPVTFTFRGGLDERAYLLWGAQPSFEWMPTHSGVLAFGGPMEHTFGSLHGPHRRGTGPIRLSSHLMGPLSTTLSRTFQARIEPRERTEGQVALVQAMMDVNGEPSRYLSEPRFVLVYE